MPWKGIVLTTWPHRQIWAVFLMLRRCLRMCVWKRRYSQSWDSEIWTHDGGFKDRCLNHLAISQCRSCRFDSYYPHYLKNDSEVNELYYSQPLRPKRSELATRFSFTISFLGWDSLSESINCLSRQGLAAKSLLPSCSMFLAAFTSRSWCVPHSGQIHSLICNGFFPDL